MPAEPGSIFICYRRDDSADVAGRIYDRLVAEFGREAIYRDVDTIPFGEDFREHVHACLTTCRVGFIIIGPEWSTIQGRAGQPRLHEPADHVRLEVEAMLGRREIRTIPLYVRSATPPQPEELPEVLQPLAFKNGADIRRDPDFHHDMDRVLEQLRPLLLQTPKKEEKKRPPKPGTHPKPNSQQDWALYGIIAAWMSAALAWFDLDTRALTFPILIILGVICSIAGIRAKRWLLLALGCLFCVAPLLISIMIFGRTTSPIGAFRAGTLLHAVAATGLWVILRWTSLLNPALTAEPSAPVGSTESSDSGPFFRQPINCFMLLAVCGAGANWVDFGFSILFGPLLMIAGVCCLIDGRRRKRPLIFWTGLSGFLINFGIAYWYNAAVLSTSADRVPLAFVSTIYAAIVFGLWLIVRWR